MFSISEVPLDFFTEDVLVCTDSNDEVILQDIYYKGNIRLSDRAKINIRDAHSPIDYFMVNNITSKFTNWNNRIDKLNLVKRDIAEQVKHYTKVVPGYQNQKRFKVYPVSPITFSAYSELFDKVKDKYTVKFKCNSFSGFVGAGLLILTKIKKEQVFMPLIITTTYTSHLPYFYLCRFLGEQPIDSFFNVYVDDLLINSKNAELKNFRIAFKEFLLPELEKCNLSIADLEDFIAKAKVPQFKKLSDRKQFLETLSEDVLHSLTSDVAVKYR